jgi:hypothetical protein
MATSLRLFYGKENGLHGRCRMNHNWGPINALSVVNITAGEANDWGSAQLLGGQNFTYNLGNANVWVSNISPHQGGVEYILNVDWPQPLNIAVTITVEDGALAFDRVTP